jgi:hypothetical protein
MIVFSLSAQSQGCMLVGLGLLPCNVCHNHSGPRVRVISLPPDIALTQEPWQRNGVQIGSEIAKCEGLGL